LQALVTRGAKPLGCAHRVTASAAVASPMGTPYLLLERATAVDDTDAGGSSGSSGSGGGSGGGGGGRSSGSGVGGSGSGGVAAAAAAGSSEQSVMSALQQALNVSGGGGMGMYYLGLQVSPAPGTRAPPPEEKCGSSRSSSGGGGGCVDNGHPTSCFINKGTLFFFRVCFYNGELQ
jgi:hypothetical protein